MSSVYRLSCLASLLVSPILLVQSFGQQGVGPVTLFRGGMINTPGSYILVRNIDAGATGIRITSSGVSLDLNGQQILGPGGKRGTGISIEGADGVEVRNGTLANFAFGVVVDNSNNVVLRQLRIRGEGLAVAAPPPEVGIMIVQSRNVVVADNAIYNTGLGVFVRGGQSWGNRIGNNTITAGTNGALGICYNPAPGDDQGPRADLVFDNVITGFNTGIQASVNSMQNLFRGNTISYRVSAIEFLNDTNQDIDNISALFP